MFGSAHSGAKAYATVGVETGVSSANPHQLIVMLFEGALIAINTAQMHMKAGNISAKGQAISKAIAIVENGLRASLDKNVGGAIAENLDALYQYIGNRLLTANLKNSPEMLEEAHRLLKDLKEAWQTIGTNNNAAAPAQPAPAPLADPLEPHSTRLMKA